jgi:hypothetical protein
MNKPIKICLVLSVEDDFILSCVNYVTIVNCQLDSGSFHKLPLRLAHSGRPIFTRSGILRVADM